jgi:hypothetical protein
MMPDSDKDLINQIKHQLDESCESIDYSTQLKLKQARQAALSQTGVKTSPKRFWQIFRVPALATAAAIALVTFVSVRFHYQEDTESLIFQDLELLAVEEDLELIQELEFYQWLEANDAIES